MDNISFSWKMFVNYFSYTINFSENLKGIQIYFYKGKKKMCDMTRWKFNLEGKYEQGAVI